MVDLKDFTIRLASEDQGVKHGDACFEVENWRNGKTYEEWTAYGDQEVAEAEYAKDFGALTWVLVRKDDPEGEVYSALGTNRTKCFVKGKGETEVKEGWWYNITAVVTPNRYRGYSYATHLIRLLHYVLTSPSLPSAFPPPLIPPFPSAWGTPPPPIPQELRQYLPRANGAMLWSDVPIEYYGNCSVGEKGGRGFASSEEINKRMVWNLRPVDSLADASDEVWVPIWQDDLPAVLDAMSAAYRRQLEQTDTSARAAFIQDPATPGAVTLTAARSGFGRQPEWRTKPIPWGLRLRGKDGEEDVVVTFSMYCHFIAPRLLITCIHNVTPAQLPSMLRALDKAVADAGAPWVEGEAWGLDTESELVKAWEGLEGREVRHDVRKGLLNHVLGVVWYDDEEVDVLDTQMWSWV
ncbi:hypothetical protein IAT38_004816 [Cryptococcus sp. DSM 104549]